VKALKIHANEMAAERRIRRKRSLLYTVSQKVSTLKLSVTLSNLNRFSIFCTAGQRTKFVTKPIPQYPYLIWPLLGMLLQYLGKLKIQIFHRYSADMKENAF